MKRIRIAIADDHKRFREFLVSTLEQFEDFEIIFDVANGLEALQQLHTSVPDIILLEVRVQNLEGLQSVKVLHNYYPNIKIIGFTLFEAESTIIELFRSGVRSIINKGEIEELVRAMRAVQHGGAYFSNRALGALQQYLFDSIPRSSVFGELTEFEFYVLTALYRRQEVYEIAVASSRDPAEVEKASQRLYSKFGATSREELLDQAIRLRLI